MRDFNFFQPKFIWLFLFFIFSNCPVFAQKSNDSVNFKQPEVSKYFIDKIIILGNNVTKEKIILRELQFKEGDTVSKNKMNFLVQKSRENLMNTSLFNFVTIDTIFSQKFATIMILVKERWYLIPSLLLKISDRNFNVWWQSKDFTRLSYGLYLTQENFRGRKESVKVFFCLGYNQEISISYQVPYVNKKQTIGLGFEVGFIGNHQVPDSNFENKQYFYKDFSHYVQKEMYSTVQLVYRRNIHNFHTFQLGYNTYSFSDSLAKLDNFSYKNKANLQYLTFYYQFKNDYRNYKSYPLTGHYFDFEFVKYGLGIINSEVYNLYYLKSSFRKYWSLGNRFYYAAGITAKYSNSENQTYFLQRDLGYENDVVRSYDYYIINGYAWAVLKNNIKFELIPKTVYKINFIKNERFSTLFYAVYLNLFADAGYVKDNYYYLHNNKLENEMLFGTGVGLDIVTYYDKVFRFEYSVNRMGQSGFFIYFIAPI